MLSFAIPYEDKLHLLISAILSALKTPSLWALHGDLGAGKTALSRQIIRTLSNDAKLEVPSPTFTIVQQYETRHGMIYHYDLYRVRDPDELHELGWHDAIADGIVLVEWPERAGHLLPAKRNDLLIAFGDHENERTIEWRQND